MKQLIKPYIKEISLEELKFDIDKMIPEEHANIAIRDEFENMLLGMCGTMSTSDVFLDIEQFTFDYFNSEALKRHRCIIIRVG